MLKRNGRRGGDQRACSSKVRICVLLGARAGTTDASACASAIATTTGKRGQAGQITWLAAMRTGTASIASVWPLLEILRTLLPPVPACHASPLRSLQVDPTSPVHVVRGVFERKACAMGTHGSIVWCKTKARRTETPNQSGCEAAKIGYPS